VLEVTKHLLDTLAVDDLRLTPAAGQTGDCLCEATRRHARSCVPGSRVVTNVVNAALAGGMLAHADETDDAYPQAGTHPGAPVVPAALAMAERRGAGGSRCCARLRSATTCARAFGMALNVVAFPRRRPRYLRLRQHVRRRRRRRLDCRPRY
jgi:2-methylcitrate dehydratase PrpD